MDDMAVPICRVLLSLKQLGLKNAMAASRRRDGLRGR
jgi:hypothetical protein